MKKLTVFLSIVVSVMLFFAVATSSVFATPGGGGVTVDCEYQFDLEDANNVWHCAHCGHENSFCTVGPCAPSGE